jgi:hypothetical protein
VGLRKVIITIPYVGKFEFEPQKGWTAARADNFLRGMKRGLVADREAPKSCWPTDEKRGYLFADKVRNFIEKHHIHPHIIYRIGVIYGPTGTGKSDNRRQSARNLF